MATFENYSNVLDNDSITGALGTTLIVAIFGTAIPIFVGALAGYAFAWIEFPGRDWLFLGVDRAARGPAPDGADPDVLALQQPRDSSTRRSR